MIHPRVIVIQQPIKHREGKPLPAFDFSKAEDYGSVEVLAQYGRDILTPDVFRVKLLAALADYDPKQDYIIPAGDYSVIFFVGSLLGKRFDTIRILRWVPSDKLYQPI